MGPITHIAEVPMEIGGHRELATLQVANLEKSRDHSGNAVA